MKTLLSLLLFTLAASAAFAADTQPIPDWLGKTVLIKSRAENNTAIRLVNALPTIAPFDKATPAAFAFKVVPGIFPGTFAFESVETPGFFMQHAYGHMVLGQKVIAEASFRIVPPPHPTSDTTSTALAGAIGVSFQSFNFPNTYISMVDHHHLDIVDLKNLKNTSKAVFYLEEYKN